jgi:F-type H+-transporting ATPase subunit b
MSLLATTSVLVARVLPASEEVPFDDQGYHTEHWLFAPTWETIIASTASIIVFGLLYKFASPTVKKAFSDRTSDIQKDLDDSAAAKAAAEAEAVRIREAKGDIDAERSRLYAEADAQAEALLADGRARLDTEMAELEARADADIRAAADRSADELRAEIARYSSDAVDRIAQDTLDDGTQQELIESFISQVGASS